MTQLHYVSNRNISRWIRFKTPRDIPEAAALELAAFDATRQLDVRCPVFCTPEISAVKVPSGALHMFGSIQAAEGPAPTFEQHSAVPADWDNVLPSMVLRRHGQNAILTFNMVEERIDGLVKRIVAKLYDVDLRFGAELTLYISHQQSITDFSLLVRVEDTQADSGGFGGVGLLSSTVSCYPVLEDAGLGNGPAQINVVGGHLALLPTADFRVSAQIATVLYKGRMLWLDADANHFEFLQAASPGERVQLDLLEGLPQAGPEELVAAVTEPRR